MRRNVVAAVLAMFSFNTLAHAQQAAAPPVSAEAASETTGRLPVKRVVLYKNGVDTSSIPPACVARRI